MSGTVKHTQNQIAIDQANQAFWDELCGSGLAQHLGITEHTLQALQRFDDAYMGFYPYLLRYLPLKQAAGKQLLEIGLGYGTVGQLLAQSGAMYNGLDIAEGPVRMMQHRLQMQHLPGQALQGSMLECPIASESMDWVVSIGCFHHTGNMQRCVDETFRVLKPGGRAMIMVYNRFSLRQWQQWPQKTWQALLYDLGIRHSAPTADNTQRQAYDASIKNAETGAPETEFFSKRQIHQIFKRFSQVHCHLENCDHLDLKLLPSQSQPLHIPREKLLPTLGKALGLDIYIEARK